MTDFGQHVIPAYIESGESVYAYNFNGYWKDVGTVDSLWQANMEFIDPNHSLNIRDKEWRITTKHRVSPPQFFTETATVSESLISSGCHISGEVQHSVISADVHVKEGAKIVDSVIMSGATIGKNAHIERAIIGEEAVVGDNAVIKGIDEIEVVGNREVTGVCVNED